MLALPRARMAGCRSRSQHRHLLFAILDGGMAMRHQLAGETGPRAAAPLEALARIGAASPTARASAASSTRAGGGRRPRGVGATLVVIASPTARAASARASQPPRRRSPPSSRVAASQVGDAPDGEVDDDATCPRRVACVGDADRRGRRARRPGLVARPRRRARSSCPGPHRVRRGRALAARLAADQIGVAVRLRRRRGRGRREAARARSSWRATRSPPAPTTSARPTRSSGSRPSRPARRRAVPGGAATAGSSPVARPRLGARPDGAADATPSAVEAARRSRRRRVDGGTRLTLPLGRPPAAALQLRFAEPPPSAASRGLASFGVRAAHALRERAQRQAALELERTRALLAARRAGERGPLALAHARRRSSTASPSSSAPTASRSTCARTAGSRRPAERGSGQAHSRSPSACSSSRSVRTAAAGCSSIEDVAGDRGLRRRRARIASAGIEAAIAVPLLVPDEVVGLLAVYPPRDRFPTENERRCSRRSRRSSRSRCRTRACTSGRRSSAAELEQALAPSGSARRQRCARSTRSRARSRRASRSRRRSRRSRARSSSCSTSTRPSSACRTGAASSSSRARPRRRRAARRGAAADPRRPQPLERMPAGALPRRRPLVLDPDIAAQLAGLRAARAVPREGLDRGRPPDRDAVGAAGHAQPRLARPRRGRSRRRPSSSRSRIAGAGGARARQRAPLPAAEGVRRHDAALAAAAHAARGAGARGRRGLRGRRRTSTSAATSTTS